MSGPPVDVADVTDPNQLVHRLSGILSFPVTPFDGSGELDEPRFRTHVRQQLSQRAGGLFPACGTGEFFSLTLDEYRTVVRAAVEEAAGAVPVVAGAGYGTRMAAEFARAAAEAGADGLLLLPPYLTEAEQAGLYEHVRQVAAASPLGVILYQRANARYAASTVERLAELPTVVGFKDGLGDLDRLQRIHLAVGDRLRFFNGLPTAELSMPAYAGMGIDLYSSAVFNFVPELAHAFRAALDEGRHDQVEHLLAGFFRPLVELRDQVRGYAVALIKAGVSHRYGEVGPPRPPLVPVHAEHSEKLEHLIAVALDLADLADLADPSAAEPASAR